jgi:hypothetical protein
MRALAATLSRLLNTCLGLSILSSLIFWQTTPIKFGIFCFISDVALGLTLQFRDYGRQAIDSGRAMEKLYKTHYLERKELDPRITTKVLSSMQPKIRVVSAVPRSANSPPLASLKSFLNRGSFSLVILNDAPEKLSPSTQLFLLHEIGHVSDPGYLIYLLTAHPFISAIGFYLPCAAFASHSWQYAAIVIVALIEILLTFGKAKIEAVADAFAISFLTENEPKARVEHLLRLLETKIKRTAEVPDREEDVELQMRFVVAVRERIKQQEVRFKPELVLSAMALPSIVCKLTVTLLIAIACGMPGPLSIRILTYVFGPLMGICFIAFRNYNKATKIAIERYHYLTSSETRLTALT